MGVRAGREAKGNFSVNYIKRQQLPDFHLCSPPSSFHSSAFMASHLTLLGVVLCSLMVSASEIPPQAAFYLQAATVIHNRFLFYRPSIFITTCPT